MPAPNSVSILASGARSFFRCDAEGNARVSAFMGERDLDYKWFWASFVSWCVRVADRSLDTVSTAPEEEVILSCLRATPTNARGLVEGLRWYETHRYIHGGVTNGLIKLGQHDVRDIRAAEDRLFRVLFPPSARLTLDPSLLASAATDTTASASLSRKERAALRREHRKIVRAARAPELEAVSLSSLAHALPSAGVSGGEHDGKTSTTGQATPSMDYSSTLSIRPKEQ